MAEKNNIDKIFRTAASGFSAPTPSGAWERMESALAAKRRRWIIFWWLFASGLVAVVFIIGLFWLGDSSPVDSQGKRVETNSMTTTTKQVIDSKSTNQILSEGEEVNYNNPDAETSQEEKKEEHEVNNSSSQTISNKKVLVSENPPADKSANEISGNPVAEVSFEESTNDSIKSEKEISYNTDDFNTGMKLEIEEESTPQINNASKDSTETNTIQISTNQPIVNDSVLPVDTGKNIPETKKPAFKPGFWLALNLGFGNTGAFTKQPELSIETTASTANALPESSVSTGISFAVCISPKWIIYGNLQSFKMKTSGELKFPDHNLKYINMNNFGYTPAGYYDADFVDYTVNSKSLSNIDYLRNFEQATTSIKSTTFSFGGGRYGQWKRWTYAYRGGLSLASLSSAKVYYGDTRAESVFGELKGIRKNIFGISTGGDLIYSFKNHMIIGLKMDVNFNLNSVNSSKEFGYYPWSFFIGPQFGLKF